MGQEKGSKHSVRLVEKVHGGSSVEKGASQLREGYKPAKPAGVSQPQPVRVPAPPSQSQSNNSDKK